MRQGKTVAGQFFRTGEVSHLDCNGFRMTRVLARNLAEQNVVTRGCGENHRRPDFAAGQIGEWKGDNDHVAGYKSRHASSSSAESQSCDQDVAAKGSRLAWTASSEVPPEVLEVPRLGNPACRAAMSLCFWSTGKTLAACSISANVLTG